jgi:predicted amidophosphoribosyltransferase
MDAAAVKRKKTREKVARWRLQQRDVCPCCGKFVARLDEVIGWCKECTDEHDRLRVRRWAA